MPKSTKSSTLSPEVLDQLLSTLFQLISDLRNPAETKQVLYDFLTQSERVMFAKRLAIALELEAGKSYDSIRSEYGVSSATISSVAEMLKTTGMKLAIEKVKTEHWASTMSSQLLQRLGLQ